MTFGLGSGYAACRVRWVQNCCVCVSATFYSVKTIICCEKVVSVMYVFVLRKGGETKKGVKTDGRSTITCAMCVQCDDA